MKISGAFFCSDVKMSGEESLMLGDKLKKARLDSGLTQQQVADLLGINRSSYTYYEIGKNKVSMQTLRLLSVIFDVSVESFLYDEPQPLVFNSDSSLKPNGFNDLPYSLKAISPEERKLLAQIRLIRGMGKEDELNEALEGISRLIVCGETDDENG